MGIDLVFSKGGCASGTSEIGGTVHGVARILEGQRPSGSLKKSRDGRITGHINSTLQRAMA